MAGVFVALFAYVAVNMGVLVELHHVEFENQLGDQRGIGLWWCRPVAAHEHKNSLA